MFIHTINYPHYVTKLKTIIGMIGMIGMNEICAACVGGNKGGTKGQIG